MKKPMNKVLIILAAIFVLALSAPLGADTGVGYSNTFSIDNTAGDTGQKPPAAWADSPYEDGFSGGLLRGQLHCHSIQDIDHLIQYTMPYTALAQDYADAGFDFIALTNHYTVSVDLPDAALLWIPGSMELTPDPVAGVAYGCPSTIVNLPHVLAIGTDSGTNADMWSNHGYWPSVVHSVQSRSDNIHSRQGLSLIAHPDDSSWNHNFAVSRNDLALLYSMDAVDGIAVYNSGGDGHYADAKWDAVLRAGYKVWGFAEEDYHPKQNFQMGKAWVAVPDASVDCTDIECKLASGNYYAYWMTGGIWPAGLGDPPRLRVTTRSSGNYPVITAAVVDQNNEPVQVDSINFLNAVGGKGYGGLSGPSSAEYPCDGSEGYVRVEIEKSYVDQWDGAGTLHVASQPVFIWPTVALGAAESEAGILSSSPELIVQFLEAADTPTPPLAGYLGYCYSVTTSDGQVPSGATLDLSYDGVDLSAIGGTEYLAIYRYDDIGTSAWVKVGGTLNIGEAIITADVTALGKYCVSADVPADTTPAEVFFDTPPYGGVVNQNTQVKVTVNDDLGPYVVRFSMNDHPLAEDADALDGWSVNLPYADYCTGDWTLKAVAEDLAGNRGEAEIPIYINSTTPRPTVTISSPSDGSALSGTVTASGTCGDDFAVAAVSLYANDTLIGYGELDGSGGWSAEIDTTNLANGSRTLTAVVHDYPGNEASASITVTVNNGTVSIKEARQGDDEQVVSLEETTVTAGTAEIGGAFYIEADNKAAGIRVATDRTIAEGARVYVAGLPATENGERQINATDIFVASSDNDLPRTLAMINRSLGGLDSGVSGAKGLYNIGLLVRVWGKVTQVGEDYLYIDDGSALKDGTLTGAEENIGVRVICDPTDYTSGDYLIVTGISSCFETPSGLARRILTRRPADIHRP